MASRAARELRLLTRAIVARDACVVLCWSALLACCALICTFGYGRDQGIYAVVARTVLDGGMPYRDAFDFKPPGIFIVYAVARGLFGDGQYAVRILEALGLLASAPAMAWLTKRHWGDARIGLAAAAFNALIQVQLDFWHTAQPESFAGVLTVYGLVCATVADARLSKKTSTAGWLVACGVLFGVAGLMKPPLAGGGAVVALLLAGRHRRLSPVGWVLVGGVVPFALCLGWFAARGALDSLVEVLLVFTPPYTKLSWVGRSVSSMTYLGLSEWLTRYSAAALAGMLLLLALRPGRGDVLRRRLRFVVVCLAVIAVQLVGVIMQAKFFPYHYGATWPLTALLASLGWFRLWAWALQRAGATSVRRALSTSLVLFAIALTIVLRTATFDVHGSFWRRSGWRLAWLFKQDVETFDGLATVADVEAGPNRAISLEVANRTRPEDPIFVWGFEPVIYDLAERPSSTRFIYNVPQRASWSREAMQKELMVDLAEKPPAAIVVEHRDVFPWVTGDAYDSHQSLYAFAELGDLIRSEYVYVHTEGDLDLYLRRPSSR